MGFRNLRTHWMHQIHILRTGPEDSPLEPKHVAKSVLIDYVCVLFDWINYFIIRNELNLRLIRLGS